MQVLPVLAPPGCLEAASWTRTAMPTHLDQASPMGRPAREPLLCPACSQLEFSASEVACAQSAPLCWVFHLLALALNTC